MNAARTPSSTRQSRPFQVLASRHFAAWLAQEQVSLALSTYQSGKLFLIGLGAQGRLSVFERTFNRPMGLWSNGQTLWMASAYQLWRFENALSDGEHDDGYDRLFVPRVGYTTGDIDVHDVAVDADGRVVFISTRFSCLGTVSDLFSFEPLWHPPFISRLAPEDRCHLNGLAIENGKPRYVTACSRSDVADGWRDHRHDGGCVVEVETGKVFCTGLSMPHSPRTYRDRLWLLDSGSGYFGYVDRAAGDFQRVTFCPGYARGLGFAGDYALIGVSKPRREQTFSGLVLDDNLRQANAAPRCGVQVVNLASGDVLHWLRLEGVVEELYDVLVLPGVVRPKALGFHTDEIRYNVWLPIQGKTTRWSGEPTDKRD